MDQQSRRDLFWFTGAAGFGLVAGPRWLSVRHLPAYTDKQKRQAEHIEEGYEHRGVPEDEAERRAWATVNKETGGGKKSGSGRGKPENARAGGNRHSRPIVIAT